MNMNVVGTFVLTLTLFAIKTHFDAIAADDIVFNYVLAHQEQFHLFDIMFSSLLNNYTLIYRYFPNVSKYFLIIIIIFLFRQRRRHSSACGKGLKEK